MKFTQLSPLALLATIITLTGAAPTTTTTSNPNDQSISKREARCDIIPGNPSMWDIQAKLCLLDYDLHPSDEMVIPAGGKNLCVRDSGKLYAGVSGDGGEQRTTKRAIAKAARGILDKCSKDGWVVGTDNVEGTNIFLVYSG
ncbi:hypothetical protein SMACR_05935 [Sordaria macrospora]|uniref:WGS project CABT00000000 data, contig 2.24 n=2 Tax=Sordaria macrospora TaxID=5147 RepID=F7W3J5_SORMK|nr:uncharacterized protein SMAC_05935 [Sordaria macrospora k-hell]KAA8628812.1 hypothetical protein SMACR_05935 [Sordaria macrospora]WPJ65400.1 hypothetical protein SMAC4_05935 [Sordaria macrospora]CCC12197.1 unnamed protein product [Sordaria macrospora k-hell]